MAVRIVAERHTPDISESQGCSEPGSQRGPIRITFVQLWCALVALSGPNVTKASHTTTKIPIYHIKTLRLLNRFI
jgi:hypothetical protein